MKGYHDSKTPISVRDLWMTPKFVFDYYNKRFNFNIDMACSDENCLCPTGISDVDDALLHETFAEYVIEAMNITNQITVWCNPPYSNIMPWVSMVVEYVETYEVTIAMLLPADTSVLWFKYAFENCAECHLISGRISFINEETKKPVNGNNKGSVVFVFDRKSPVKKHVVLIDRDSMKESSK